jgi:hypothetical protein
VTSWRRGSILINQRVASSSWRRARNRGSYRSLAGCLKADEGARTLDLRHGKATL